MRVTSRIVESMKGELEIESEVGKRKNVKIIFAEINSVHSLDSIIP